MQILMAINVILCFEFSTWATNSNYSFSYTAQLSRVTDYSRVTCQLGRRAARDRARH